MGHIESSDDELRKIKQISQIDYKRSPNWFRFLPRARDTMPPEWQATGEEFPSNCMFFYGDKKRAIWIHYHNFIVYKPAYMGGFDDDCFFKRQNE